MLDSRRVEISDPDVPDSKQPYHAGFGTARDAGDELKRLVSLVKTYGRKSVTALLREYQKQATLRGAGVIVGSLIDPQTIGNDHIRIHAMEGQLFRTVVIDAAEKARIDVRGMPRTRSVCGGGEGVEEARSRRFARRCRRLAAMSKAAGAPNRKPPRSARG